MKNLDALIRAADKAKAAGITEAKAALAAVVDEQITAMQLLEDEQAMHRDLLRAQGECIDRLATKVAHLETLAGLMNGAETPAELEGARDE